MDDPMFLTAVQTICAVLGLAFTVYQLVDILLRRRRRKRRGEGDESRVERTNAKVDLASVSASAIALPAGTLWLSVGAFAYLGVAIYVSLSAEVFRFDDIDYTLWRLSVTAVTLLVVGWSFTRKIGSPEFVVTALAAGEFVGIVFLPPSNTPAAPGPGFIPLALLVVFRYSEGRPLRQGFLSAFFIICCGAFSLPQSTIACLIVALLLSRDVSVADRWKVRIIVLAASAFYIFAMLRRWSVKSTLLHWAFPEAHPYFQAWQRDRYFHALETAKLWGTSSTGLDQAFDLDGVAWPVMLTMRLGWIPAIAIVGGLLAWLAVLTARASRLKESRTAALALSLGALIFFVLNLLVLAGVLPMFGLVAIGFAGPIGLSAGSVWILIALRLISGRDPFRARAEPYHSDTRPRPVGFPFSSAPLRWLLVWFGLADEVDAEELQPQPGRKRRKK